MDMSRLTRDRTAEPVSREQILRHERGQGNIHLSCSADHVQDWQVIMSILGRFVQNIDYIVLSLQVDFRTKERRLLIAHRL